MVVINQHVPSVYQVIIWLITNATKISMDVLVILFKINVHNLI